VTAGKFSFSFVVPKDINYEYGNGRISYYVKNGSSDGNGNFSGIVIGGSLPETTDQHGPEISGWLNDEHFQDNDQVNEQPLLIVHLKDSSGINISKAFGGHGITGMIDNNPADILDLSPYYESEAGKYEQGTVRITMTPQSEGSHTILIKAWDGANNSSEQLLHFRVKKQQAEIVSLSNYPNPMSHETRICFEFNKPGYLVTATVDIFNSLGQLIKSIDNAINTNAYRSCDIEWDGLDESGRMVRPGIYYYHLQVQMPDGTKANKTKKLVVL
jgi:hypothetical protein